jgi:predicted transcriptional regulator
VLGAIRHHHHYRSFWYRSDVPEACYLRWLIAFKGVSQTEIAGQLGCSPSLVSLWAWGNVGPPRITSMRYAYSLVSTDCSPIKFP